MTDSPIKPPADPKSDSGATKSRGGAPKRNRNARKSGRYALEKSLKRDGFSVLTRRQREAVREWRDQIIVDRGGRQQWSQLQLMQLERFIITEILIQSIDSYLMTQSSLVNRRKKSLYPVVVERGRLAELSLKLATAIGLDRKAMQVDVAALLADAAKEPRDDR
jgi:hypothetical protein